MTIFVFSFILSCFQVSCMDCTYAKGKRGYDLLFGSNQSNSIKVDKISRFSDDELAEILVYEIDCLQGNQIQPYLADRGLPLIKKVISKIESAKYPWTKAELGFVIELINKKCKCLNRNSEEFKKLEVIANELSDGDDTATATYNQIFRNTITRLRNE
jgi:hypothetical protein